MSRRGQWATVGGQVDTMPGWSPGQRQYHQVMGKGLGENLGRGYASGSPAPPADGLRCDGGQGYRQPLKQLKHLLAFAGD